MSNKGLQVDGISLSASNTHHQQQAETEGNLLDINELKRRIERREAENKRKDREITLLQKEILNLTKELSDFRTRNETLQQSLSQARLLTGGGGGGGGGKYEEEIQIAQNLIADLQLKLTQSDSELNRVLGDYEVMKATNITIKEQLIESLATSEVRSKEIQSLKEELYSMSIKLKTLQIRLDEKDQECEKLKVVNETILKAERLAKNQLEHEKTIIYEHERTINDLLATNKRIMAQNLIKSETNQFLSSELSEMNKVGAVLTPQEMEIYREIEIRNKTLQERNNDLQKSIELHMDLLHRAEEENNVLKLQFKDEKDLREQLQNEMRQISEGKSNNETVFEQMKKEIVKLRKENKVLIEKYEEIVRQGQNSGQSGYNRDGDRNKSRNGNGPYQMIPTRGEEKKQIKISEETIKALRNRLSFLLEQLAHLTKQSSLWNEQKLILKSQISSLLEANISLRERLLSVQRSFMERSLYELDHPAVRRNAKPVFLTENEEDHIVKSGIKSPGGTGEFEYASPEEVVEGALVTHQLIPQPKNIAKNVAEEMKAREARLLEYSMRSDLGEPLPYTVEGFIERTLFDTLCAFTSGNRQNESDPNSKHQMKPKVLISLEFIFSHF
jgi:DNA repair exonuclease SbcCD ATPase subunit